MTLLEIMNNALRVLACNLIASPTENSESARQANACFSVVARAELEAQAWSFAKAQVGLPLDGTVPLYRFANQYALPQDFLRLVELEDKWLFPQRRPVDINPTPMYEIQGQKILTNFAPPLRISYIRDVSAAVHLWPATFCQTVAMALAVQLAIPLTKSDSMLQRAEQLYEKELARARRTNAIQIPQQLMPDFSWVAARVY